jgi:hypothetical protein
LGAGIKSFPVLFICLSEIQRNYPGIDYKWEGIKSFSVSPSWARFRFAYSCIPIGKQIHFLQERTTPRAPSLFVWADTVNRRCY